MRRDEGQEAQLAPRNSLHHPFIPALRTLPNFEYNLFRHLYILPTHGERDPRYRGAEGASQGRSHAFPGDTLRQTDRRDAATLERTPTHSGVEDTDGASL